MSDDEQASQHADMLAFEEAAVKALKKAHDLGLSESECMAIAYVAGLPNEVYKALND